MSKNVKLAIKYIACGLFIVIFITGLGGMVINKLEDSKVIEYKQSPMTSVTGTINGLRERLDIKVAETLTDYPDLNFGGSATTNLELHRIANQLEDLNKNLERLLGGN